MRRKNKTFTPPPLPRDPASGELLIATPQYLQAYRAAENAVFTSDEIRYREHQARADSVRFALKQDRDEAGVPGPFVTMIFLAGIGYGAYQLTHGPLVTLVIVSFVWVLLRALSDHSLWRLRAERRLQHAVLKDIHKLFIDKMRNDLDQCIGAEIAKQMSDRFVVVPNKVEADAILRAGGNARIGLGGVRGIRPEVFGAVRDDAKREREWILLVDKAEKLVLWSDSATASFGEEQAAKLLVKNLNADLT